MRIRSGSGWGGDARVVGWTLAALALVGCRPQGPTANAPGLVTGSIDESRPLPSPLPPVAARINGQPITTLRVAAHARTRPDRGNLKDGPSAKALRETLRELARRELLFQDAVAKGITPDPAALERAYDQARAEAGSPAAWTGRLSSEGWSESELREEIRLQATVSALVASLAPRVPGAVSEDEARSYYGRHAELHELPERYIVAQILLRVAAEATPEQRAAALRRAAELRRRLEQGADFAAMARTESDAGASGELPALEARSLEPDFAVALAALQPGEISNVIPSPLGLHILKLKQRLPASAVSFDQARAEIARRIVDDETQQTLEALVKALEARARIEFYL